MGVVVQAGLGQNPARTAAFRGGIGLHVPATTLNNVCLAGLDSVCDASRRVAGAEGQVFLVGGFDSMSRHVPIRTEPGGEPVNAVDLDGLTCSIGGGGMGLLSDRTNAELGIDREAQDSWALGSHQRAAKAPFLETGEVMSLTVDGRAMSTDEGVRFDSSVEALARLRPVFMADGTITAGNAAQMTDGASAGVVGTFATAERLGLEPLGRIAGWAYTAGPDTSLHLKPAQAISDVLARCGLGLADIDLFEINEAFAGVVVASCRKLGLPGDVVNVNGGAIALGHPLGGTGFRLLHTLALELRRRGLRRGIAALCGGGGQGLAVLIERER
jgi:acetyl-CoA C-acetyltransferase